MRHLTFRKRCIERWFLSEQIPAKKQKCLCPTVAGRTFTYPAGKKSLRGFSFLNPHFLPFGCFTKTFDPSESKHKHLNQRGLTGSLPTFSRPDREGNTHDIPQNTYCHNNRLSSFPLLHGKKKSRLLGKIKNG